jgi:hypothetical protein
MTKHFIHFNFEDFEDFDKLSLCISINRTRKIIEIN